MLKVFELEKKLTDNLFVVKFFERKEMYLIQSLPLRIWTIDNYEHISDNDLIEMSTDSDSAINHFADIPILPVPLFIVTNNCNLACDYCYADEGSYGCEGVVMTHDVIDKTFSLLYKKYSELIRKHNHKEIDVNAICFGGEPFINLQGMMRILENQKEIAAKLQKEFPNTRVNILQHINTNGFGLQDASIKYISDNSEFVEFVISFDGINHDLHRRDRNKQPTSNEVINTIKKLAENGFKLSVTCCLHPNELSNFDDNIKYLTELFGKDISVNFSFLRGSLHFRNLAESGKKYLYDENEILSAAKTIKKYLADGYSIYSKKFSDLQERASLFRCPAIGKNEICIMPDGSIYPCHNFVDKRYSYGNVLKDDEIILKNDAFDPLVEKRNIFSQTGCSDCCMKSICLSSFDCPSHSLFDLGSMNELDNGICDFARIVQYKLLLNAVSEGLN